MIGVDTNVLVRIFAEDDPRQHRSAQRFMRNRTAEDPAFVSAVVIAEVCWVLDKSYGFEASSIQSALEWLFDSVNVLIEHPDLIPAAVAVAVERNGDISDSVIAAIAANAGATSTVTFDRPAASRIPGMELLE